MTPRTVPLPRLFTFSSAVFSMRDIPPDLASSFEWYGVKYRDTARLDTTTVQSPFALAARDAAFTCEFSLLWFRRTWNRRGDL